jgi:hypothetical protein
MTLAVKQTIEQNNGYGIRVCITSPHTVTNSKVGKCSFHRVQKIGPSLSPVLELVQDHDTA